MPSEDAVVPIREHHRNMPERDKLSWLTPKRRRTTGNLKSIPHGQVMKSIAEEEDGLAQQAQTDSASSGGAPLDGLTNGHDGNLFYAYARKTDEPEPYYLLTFASASTTTEWWLLIQSTFPDCSRPSLQLFSFHEPDLPLRAWNHPALQHLRSKWMYRALSGTGSKALGRAPQAVIPIQDEMGNVLGQSREQSAAFEDLDTRFERMLQSTERNTGHVGRVENSEEQVHRHGSNGGVDAKTLAVHFDKLTDMMARNIAFMENMSAKQLEHEQRLTAALESVASKRREDRVDLSQLSAHLDRVNRTLDQTAARRRDSTRSEASPAADLTPLLEKMQEAIEQNSLLTEKLLDERSTADAEARYKNQLDLLPISESLERIYEAVDKQNLHTTALLEILRDDKDDALRATLANGETLDRILQAQIETKEAVQQTGGEIDFTPVAEHMDAIREVTTENTEQITAFIELQKTASAGKSTTNRTPNIDFSPMTDRLDRVHATLEKPTGYFQVQSPGTGDPQFLMSALSSHLSKIQAVTEQNAHAIKTMRDRQPPPLANTPPAPAQKQIVDETTHTIIRETNAHLLALTRALTTRQLELEGTEQDRLLEKRIEATSSQVRELMAGQRGMVHVMRELAVSISASSEKNRGGAACEHVVIPPPRKVGRKIVGFVYDGKEGVV